MTFFKRFSALAIAAALASTSIGLASDVEAIEAADEKASEITLNSNPAVLERTAETARKLKVTLPVTFQNQVCTQTATRRVVGQHPSCGYTTIPVYRCYGGGYGPGYPYPYPRPYPGPGYPRPYPGPYYPGPYHPGYNGCGYYPEQVMNSCEHDQSYCAQYGTVSTTKQSTVTIRFKKNTALSGNETETYELSGNQMSVDSDDVNFILKGQNTRSDYAIKSKNGLFGGEQIVVKKKRD